MHSRKPGTTRGFGDFEFHAPVSSTRGFSSGNCAFYSNEFRKKFLNPRGGVNISLTLHVTIKVVFGCQYKSLQIPPNISCNWTSPGIKFFWNVTILSL